MPVAFTMTLVYFIPWLVVLYYLFLKKDLYFLIAFLVYLVAFVVHFLMARMLSREVAVQIIMKDAGIERIDNEKNAY